MRPLFLLIAMLTAVPNFALAAIYKCEWNGHVIYSSERCPGGKPVDLREKARNNPPIPKPVIQKQVEQARKESARLQQERLERQQRERELHQQYVLSETLDEKKCVGLALRKRWAEEDLYLAGAYDADNASRAHVGYLASRYASECSR